MNDVPYASAVGIALSQSTYIDKVLKRFNMENSKKGLLPMSPGTVLCKNQSPGLWMSE